MGHKATNYLLSRAVINYVDQKFMFYFYPKEGTFFQQDHNLFPLFGEKRQTSFPFPLSIFFSLLAFVAPKSFHISSCQERFCLLFLQMTTHHLVNDRCCSIKVYLHFKTGIIALGTKGNHSLCKCQEEYLYIVMTTSKSQQFEVTFYYALNRQCQVI